MQKTWLITGPKAGLNIPILQNRIRRLNRIPSPRARKHKHTSKRSRVPHLRLSGVNKRRRNGEFIQN